MKTAERQNLLSRAADAPALRARLARVAAATPVRFSHVVEAAQPFLAAIVARHAERTTWVICENVRAQERVHDTLSNWIPDALFLPEAEFAAVENVLPDPEITAERLAVFAAIEREKRPQIIVTTRTGLTQPAPTRGTLASSALELRRGRSKGLEAVLQPLVDAGYERVAQVTTRGQFAVRGGIVDIFSWQAQLPVRVEFFGDDIESLREFDVDMQTSVGALNLVHLLLGNTADLKGAVRDHIAADALTIELDATEDSDAHVQISEAWIEEGPEDFSLAFPAPEIGDIGAGDFAFAETKRAQFVARLSEWRANGAAITIYFQTEGEIERFHELISESAISNVELVVGTVTHGFVFPAANLVVLSAAELFGRFPAHARRRLQRAERLGRQRTQIDFSELREGELVVHLEHGIGRFAGLTKAPGADQEVIELEFANSAKVYVPLEQAYLVSRYVGVGKKSPALTALGDPKWARAKKTAAASIFDYAGKMLAVQAERETNPGFAFGPDTKWQLEFEHSFPFRETPDQLRAILETKRDMELARPMDRLICGDVGFGKTEVAIRAAFKAVMEGKQVVMLAPTTVLAQQHYETFRQRMLEYPVRTEMLSRFRTQAEQKKVLQLLRDGGVDIVIGTHRLISGDVVFKDLGLVVIDEEQRFGVLHKEKFKELFKLVDVLTLSATPIPRTLYLSLVGVKDMSTIETPPLNRLPVETVVCGYDERIVRDAINRELERQGQVYFLHNRVQSIDKVRERILELCPQARVDVGHGQMDADELEDVMTRFVAGKTDVLVCTTIIESGLDIPNANTIIIDRADRFGLADLYQLRGRVGRAEHKAYAYLLLPREMMTVGAARKRINAIKQYSSLGAGFRIAMRDLEIRGAGSILGTQQSGHIIAIGFDLYCQLLKQAVGQIKGQRAHLRLDVDVRLDFVATNEAEFLKLGPEERVPAFIPASYISETPLRIQAYRRVAEVTSKQQLDALRKEWEDRFGALAPAARNLLAITDLKLAATRARVTSVEVRDRKLMLTRGGDLLLVAGKFPRLVAAHIDQHLEEILGLIKTLR